MIHQIPSSRPPGEGIFVSLILIRMVPVDVQLQAQRLLLSGQHRSQKGQAGEFFVAQTFLLCSASVHQDIREFQMPALHVYFFGENGADPNCELHIPGADDSFFLISVYSFEMHRIKLLYLISFKYYIEKPHETIIDHQEQFV